MYSWAAFGDHENLVKQFANLGDFSYIPSYSRK